jgi:hypothetical protein
VERDLKQCKLPYEEWEVLYREILTVRVAMLRRHPALADTTFQTIASAAAALSLAAAAVPQLVGLRRNGPPPRREPSAAPGTPAHGAVQRDANSDAAIDRERRLMEASRTKAG